MTPKKILAGAAMLAALGTGGLVGATIGVPSVSLASVSTVNPLASSDTTSSDTPTDPAGEPAPDEAHHMRLFISKAAIEAAAKTLGMSVDDLHSQLQDGKTIAEIATAKNVDVDTVIASMVAAAKDEFNSTIDERVTDFVNNGRPERPFGDGLRHRIHEFLMPRLEAAADALGLTREELVTQLRDGKTLAEIAKAQNVDVDKVINVLVTQAEKLIDQAVTDGHLSKDKAAEIKSTLTDRITKLVNEGLPFRHGPR